MGRRLQYLVCLVLRWTLQSISYHVTLIRPLQHKILTGISRTEKAAAFSLLNAAAFTLSSNCFLTSSENPASCTFFCADFPPSNIASSVISASFRENAPSSFWSSCDDTPALGMSFWDEASSRSGDAEENDLRIVDDSLRRLVARFRRFCARRQDTQISDNEEVRCSLIDILMLYMPVCLAKEEMNRSSYRGI